MKQSPVKEFYAGTLLKQDELHYNGLPIYLKMGMEQDTE